MDLEDFARKLEASPFDIKVVTELCRSDTGGKVIRIYDPSGNLIEIREA